MGKKEQQTWGDVTARRTRWACPGPTGPAGRKTQQNASRPLVLLRVQAGVGGTRQKSQKKHRTSEHHFCLFPNSHVPWLLGRGRSPSLPGPDLWAEKQGPRCGPRASPGPPPAGPRCLRAGWAHSLTPGNRVPSNQRTQPAQSLCKPYLFNDTRPSPLPLAKSTPRRSTQGKRLHAQMRRSFFSEATQPLPAPPSRSVTPEKPTCLCRQRSRASGQLYAAPLDSARGSRPRPPPSPRRMQASLCSTRKGRGTCQGSARDGGQAPPGSSHSDHAALSQGHGSSLPAHADTSLMREPGSASNHVSRRATAVLGSDRGLRRHRHGVASRLSHPSEPECSMQDAPQRPV